MKISNFKLILFAACLTIIFAVGCLAQTGAGSGGAAPPPPPPVAQNAQPSSAKTGIRTTVAAAAAEAAIKSSPAYAELLLRKIELESLLEDFLASYTETFPKVKETRYEIDLIRKDLTRLLSLKDASETQKMTTALGKIMVRRAELQTIAWSLQSKYGEQHPEVLRARRRAASFEKAVGEIFP